MPGDHRGYEKNTASSGGGSGGDATSIKGINVDTTGLQVGDTLVYDGTKFVVQTNYVQLQVARILNFDGVDIIESEYCGFHQNGSSAFFARVAGAVNGSNESFYIRKMVFAFDDVVDEQDVFVFKGLDESPLVAGLISLVNTAAPGNPAYEYIVEGLNIEIPPKHKIAVKFITSFFNTKLVTITAYGGWFR